MKPARVFFYVQHLLGIGHLKRAATLARALAEAGLEVTLASGGLPVAGMAPPGVRLVQLPPASAADMTFKKLLDESGREIDADWILRRTAATHAAFLACDPEVMVLELFPFGRWQMAFELQSLLELARKRARRPVVVCCSVRDLLSRKRAAREREIASMVERYIDHVMVHADPSVIRLEQTFSLASRIAARIEYTGYVVDSLAEKGASGAGADEVIVSAGGGAVGEALLDAAMRARHLTSLKDRTWRVLAGNNLNHEAYARLGQLAAKSGGGMVLERSRADFVTLLANCELSVSQAGYNTLMEAMSVGARAVVVPFAGAAETEQTLRALCFAERGLVEMLEESALTPAALAAAIDRAAARPKPAPGALDLDGARKSAALVARWAGWESE